MPVTRGMGGSAAASRLALNWREGMNFVQAAFWYGMGSMQLASAWMGFWMDSTHLRGVCLECFWHPREGALQHPCGPMF